ncbi:MAG: 2-hydroxyglutaryl-CoA dehydratase [Firmicutes bacterium]|nr:2-hydroxyglutaryl-CoA dehydratase [Bacillota bacterium]
MQAYLGIDLGSVSTNFLVLGPNSAVLAHHCLRTQGDPITAIKAGLTQLKKQLAPGVIICGAGSTGSGRHLAGVMIGADTVKNEITAHGIAAAHEIPAVQTVLEIGGQDSKIIILRQGMVTDFAMNTVCAAGTGSFLDRQAERLGLSIEHFGQLALESKNPVRIAGRCAVFAESDMIHKQQLGHSMEDISRGLCQALVRNYLNNVAKGKEILAPILFQGGVAANRGIKQAFEEALEQEVIVPKHHAVMGALGAALLAKQTVSRKKKSSFRGFEVSHWNFKVRTKHCNGCSNTCEVVKITAKGQILACWGDRCGRWSADPLVNRLNA